MRGIKFVFFIFITSMAFGLVPSQVYINEIEINPDGTDSGEEWVELYNTGSEINLNGWSLYDGEASISLIYDFSENDTIGENNFLVVNVSGLNNGGDFIMLNDSNGNLIDITPELEDGDDDDFTWQRVPDGLGNFTFKETTKGSPNQLTLIENKTSSDSCIVYDEDFSLNVYISGFCVETVIFSVDTSQGKINFTGSEISEGNYTIRINSTILNGTGNFDWTVYTTDCFNMTVSSGIENFYINKMTVLDVNPNEPDGLINYYINEPIFQLSNSDANEIYYKWDAHDILSYSGSFGLEDTPNNWIVTGGIADLNFWSDFGDCNESIREELFLFDFNDPIFQNVKPENASVVFNSMPEISVIIKDLYGDNSGLNFSTILLEVNGDEVSPNIDENGDFEAEVTYIPNEDLDNGVNEVILYVKDNAGRESELNWFFNVNETVEEEFSVNLNSPLESLYNERRLEFDIEASGESELIEYIDYSDSRPRFKSLCRRNCEDFERSLSFNDGEHNLTLRIYEGDSENFIEKNLYFTTDTKDPRISSTDPRRGFGNGDIFVEFDEDNPVNLTLIYGNTESGIFSKQLDIENECVLDRRYECMTNVNLSDFDEEIVNYHFELTDIVGNFDYSREEDFMVDNSAPVLNDFNYSIDKRRVEFMFNISDKNFDEINYIDFEDRRPRERRLCSRLKDDICEVRRSFSEGEHNITFSILDDAENMISHEIFFEIE